jgi:hypothetical protein
MRRAASVLAVVVVAIAVAFTPPVSADATPSTSAAAAGARHRCKHKGKKRSAKHEPRRKQRCRKKRGATGPAAGKPGKPGKPGKQDDPAGPSGPPSRLLATSLESSPTQLQLQLSRATLPAGAAIVEQYNAGEDPHDLILERQGMVVFSLPTLDPGLNQRQTVNLARGTWTLYCSLLNHRELGMQATLTVD